MRAVRQQSQPVSFLEHPQAGSTTRTLSIRFFDLFTLTELLEGILLQRCPGPRSPTVMDGPLNLLLTLENHENINCGF